MEERQVKQIIVMRRDLNMRKGKMIAQGAHASMKVILDKFNILERTTEDTTYTITLNNDSPIKQWLFDKKFTKITVSVNSELELLEIYYKAKELLIPCSLIEDLGLTEFNGVPTKTCCAIGPFWSDEIDQITKQLQLL